MCCQKLLERLNIEGDDASYIHNYYQLNFTAGKGKVKLQIASVEDGNIIELPNVHSVSSLPITPHNALTTEELLDWPHLQDIRIPKINNGKVSLLIGVDVPEVFWMLDERRGKTNEPYAVKQF